MSRSHAHTAGKKCKSHLKATLNAHTFIPTQQQQQKSTINRQQ